VTATATRDDLLERIEAEAEAAPQPRFRLLGIAEVEQLEDPTYLIDGVLPENAAVMLYGAPGDGKTFLALDIALTVASSSREWFGKAVRNGRVVYIAAEGLGGLKRRIISWVHAHQGAEIQEIQFVGQAVQLLQIEDVAELTTAIDAYSLARPALIIMDTLSRCTPGGDENSVQDTSLAVRSVDFLRRLYGCTVLVIHHTQKGGDLERGSGNWRASVDVMLHVRNDDAVRELRTTKVRDGAPLEGLRFVLRPTLESCVIATPDPADDDRLTPNQKEALAVLGRLAVDGSGVTANAWLKASALQERTFYNCSAKLQSLNFVRKNRNLYTLTVVGEMQLQMQQSCKRTANA